MVLYYACANTECGFRWTDLSADNKSKQQQVPQDDEDNLSEGYIEDDSYMNEMLYNAQGLESAYQGNKCIIYIFVYLFILQRKNFNFFFFILNFFLIRSHIFK